MSDQRKRYSIDCNFNWLGPSKPAISHKEAEEWGLQPGDHIVVYQDDDEWGGTVRFDQTLPYQYQWYVELD
jgi:hypothetical protein